MYHLRDYQNECLTSIRDYYEDGDRRLLVVLPTGTGKAVVIAHAHGVIEGKTLVVVHREELVKQLAEKMLAVNKGSFVGIERAEERASPYCDIVICSVQTFGKVISKRRARFKEFKKIFIDEAHHSPAKGYKNILEHYGFLCTGGLESPDDCLLVGYTATPKRSDNLGLDKIFGTVAFYRSLPEMIGEGWLTDIKCERIYSTTDLGDVKLSGGDYKETELGAKINTDYRNSLIVNAYLSRARGLKTIVFCSNVQHTRDVTDLFCRNGISAALVVGSTEQHVRAGVIRDFKKGKIEVLVGCQVFTEGFDVPNIGCVIMGRPTKSQLLYIQMMGRGTRPACDLPINSTAEERRLIIEQSEKPNLLLLDVVDNSRNNSPVMLPTIFGLNEAINLRDKTIVKALKELKEKIGDAPLIDVKDVERLQKLNLEVEETDIFKTKTPKEIKSLSKLSWLSSGEDAYEINPVPYEKIRIEQDTLGKWHALITSDGVRNEDDSYVITPRETKKVASGRLEEMIQRADKYIEREYPKAAPLLLRDAKWKNQLASSQQIQFLEKHTNRVKFMNKQWHVRDGATYIPLTRDIASGIIGEKIKQWKEAKQKSSFKK